MFSNSHNLQVAPHDGEKCHGIRISVTASDPFRNLLDEDWETFHWYSDAHERDAALAEMSRRHEFSRLGDRPTLRYEPVDR